MSDVLASNSGMTGLNVTVDEQRMLILNID